MADCCLVIRIHLILTASQGVEVDLVRMLHVLLLQVFFARLRFLTNEKRANCSRGQQATNASVRFATKLLERTPARRNSSHVNRLAFSFAALTFLIIPIFTLGSSFAVVVRITLALLAPCTGIPRPRLEQRLHVNQSCRASDAKTIGACGA